MWSEVQAVSGLPAFEGLAKSFAGPLLEDFKVGEVMGVDMWGSGNGTASVG